ncbi:MAG TPA: hypothetical protein VMU09_04790 [Acidimicrobiales bacterium]|nr:hypothetical protein [Acidimicrobiales bacterium]
MFRLHRRQLGGDHTRGWVRAGDGRARGHARPGWAEPAAGGPEGPRVLIESDDGAEATALVRVLERQGYRCAWCPGPGTTDARDCPLVRDGCCPLVEGADAVVSTLSLEHAGCRQVLAAMARSSPATPVVLAATPAGASRWSHHLTGRRVLQLPLTARGLLDALDAALGADVSR